MLFHNADRISFFFFFFNWFFTLRWRDFDETSQHKIWLEKKKRYIAWKMCAFRISEASSMRWGGTFRERGKKRLPKYKSVAITWFMDILCGSFQTATCIFKKEKEKKKIQRIRRYKGGGDRSRQGKQNPNEKIPFNAIQRLSILVNLTTNKIQTYKIALWPMVKQCYPFKEYIILFEHSHK